MRVGWAFAFVCGVAACGGDPTDSAGPVPARDDDGDGWTTERGDCDDGDPQVHPAAEELCDGLDNDCDGETDEPDAQDASTFYPDLDGDGFGDGGSPTAACTLPSGHVQDSGDCDDADPSVHPMALEHCNDVDDDCDGTIDEPDAEDATTWYYDADQDGWGGDQYTVERCEQPYGYVSVDGDCDDGNSGYNPGAIDDDQVAGDTDCDGADEPVDLRDTHLVSLVISELMPNPAGGLGVAGQWLEIANGSVWDVDLEGLELREGQRGLLSVDEPLVLAAGDALLFANTEDSVANGGVVPDRVSSELELEYDGALMRLVAWGVELDAVQYGAGWASAERPGYALALDEGAHDPDANDDVDAWCLGLEPYGEGGAGSPGLANGACIGDLEDADGDGVAGGLFDGDDCDDLAADVYPEAPEDCRDGVDQDCDGALDCLDADCWGDGACEDCSDGADDDGDGLVDCEDGDCVGNPACEEIDCGDGLDSDGDGLVDCDDDDCWHGACHPGGVASRVHGGRMSLRTRGYRERQLWFDGAMVWTHTTLSYEHSATARSVWGTVQVLPAGATSWDATSARSTCTWSVASASMRWRWLETHSSSVVELPVVNRASPAVAEGCRVAGSWFLPGELVPASGVAWADNSWRWSRTWLGGTPWYQGSTTAGTPWRTTTSGSAASAHEGVAWTRWSHASSLELLLSPWSPARFYQP